MKIAVTSSGLGFIQRGIEAWAKSLAEGLSAEKTSVTLYHGGGGEYRCRHRSLDYRSRFHPLYRLAEGTAPCFTWRWGWKSSYIMEQKSFASALIKELKNNPADIVHTQDIHVAIILTEARRKGIVSTRTILAHGTDEFPDMLDGIDYLQHLAPVYKKEAEERQEKEGKKQYHFCIPNFVDTGMFSSAGRQECLRERERIGMLPDSLLIGTAGAVKKSHKRIDSLIRECSIAIKEGRKIHLLIAGAETGETPALMKLAEELLEGRCTFSLNRRFEEMPQFYKMLDLYVHPAAEEFFGISIIEAMACGVPVVVNETPALKWIVGDAGWNVNVMEEGYLAGMIEKIQPGLKDAGTRARGQVEDHFSWKLVYPMFMKMYEEVMET